MTEKDLIDFLSEESEKMNLERFEDKYRFETDICGWRDTKQDQIPKCEYVPQFRIRTVLRKGSISRSNSSVSHKSTVSSGASENSSPVRETDKSRHSKKNSNSFPESFAEINITTKNMENLRVFKPAKARRARKPIKVFKLPNVSQENDE